MFLHPQKPSLLNSNSILASNVYNTCASLGKLDDHCLERASQFDPSKGRKGRSPNLFTVAIFTLLTLRLIIYFHACIIKLKAYKRRQLSSTYHSIKLLYAVITLAYGFFKVMSQSQLVAKLIYLIDLVVSFETEFARFN